MDYKDRLIDLHLLPLMMEFEISDITFLVKSMKNRSPHFDVFNFLECCHHSTLSSSSFKLRHSLSKNNTQGNFYFNRISRLWNSLPPLDINLSLLVINPLLESLYFPFQSTQYLFLPLSVSLSYIAALNFLYVCYSLSSFVVCVLCVLYRSSGCWPSAFRPSTQTFSIQSSIHPVYSFHLLCCKI